MTSTMSSPPWTPADLPTLRAAYADRTAALMAFLAEFAYSPAIEAQSPFRCRPRSRRSALTANLVSQWIAEWLGVHFDDLCNVLVRREAARGSLIVQRGARRQKISGESVEQSCGGFRRGVSSDSS